MIKTIYKFVSFLTLCGFFFTSCEERDFEPLPLKESLLFSGEVVEDGNIATRAPEAFKINREEFDTDFYLELVVNGNKKCRTYRIPDVKPGMLRSYLNDADSLKWVSRDDLHTFYGWTMPWADNDSYKNDYQDGTRVSFQEDDDLYSNVADNKNCAILESFIGAKAGPTTFQQNSEQVYLEFKHLVSKIHINRLLLTYTNDNGVATRAITGTIIFYNLPSEGVFYRNGTQDKEGPVVIGKTISDTGEPVEVAYYKVNQGSYLYVCPDVDLSKVSFRITDHNAPSTDKGDFFGDFSNINLERKYDDSWDNSHRDPHVLYAGEVLELNINLRQGRGSIFKTNINSWNTSDVKEGTASGRDGIYDDLDMKYFNSLFDKGFPEDLEDETFAIYGDEDHNEYRLYSDLDGLSHGFYVGKKYVFNGMGHTINFSQPYIDEGGTLYRVRISRVKNIYITDNYGHKIYIDDNFNIFLVDDNGNLIETPYNLPPFEGQYADCYHYLINLETGQVYPQKQ